MGVVSVTLMPQRDRSGGDNSQGTRTLREVYKIVVDGKSDTVSTMLDDAKVPAPGEPHPEDSVVTLKNRSFRNLGVDTFKA